MDAEKKRLIVEALRSGRYRQGRQCLRSAEDRYCCLGVICDISGAGHWDDRPIYIGGTRMGYVYRDRTGDYSGGILPREVAEWAGLSTANGGIMIAMNDDGKTFDEIADWMEAAF